MKKHPRILITNDDGIEAESIWLIKRSLSELGHCEIVAPRYPRSASSHAVSLTGNIRLHPWERDGFGRGYGVDGTPADSIKFALSELFKQETFDLIVSGINLGPNTGVSVYYSGTIAAAREGVISGIPAFAVSVSAFEWQPDFAHAVGLTKQIAAQYLAGGLPPDYFLNVNGPGVSASAVRGIRLTRQAPSRFVEIFEKMDHPEGKTYRLSGEIRVLNGTGDTDQEALAENYVSVTPLSLDMTHYGHMDKTRDLLKALELTSLPDRPASQK
ncbi:MAG: 5'/3'-nucleotidase SurE [Candidatus Omnitrophica bacterium]|nr:5'/3'-nucleotidase SurE [Candidatus Omnitrophota bacterium]